MLQTMFKETKHFQLAGNHWESLVEGTLSLVRDEICRPPTVSKAGFSPASRIEITVHPGFKVDVRLDQDVEEPLFDSRSRQKGFGEPV